GGDEQDQCALQLLLNVIEFGMNAVDAVSAPRFHTHHYLGSFRQKAPELGSLLLNARFDDALSKEMQARGFKVKTPKGLLSAPVLLRIDPQTRVIEAAGDPRTRRHAAAY
ncbi:MAG TPA: gamma-glutamyltransferase, partial [Gemmataceae bacterium]|nr:gamma-glutamyltransferase [Gemmataceae bacterium]